MVTWEECDRGTEEFWFETEDKFADHLTCDPHAFLVGCTIPAFHYGEKRVWIDAEICPKLRHGLNKSLALINHWYYGSARQPFVIEARTRSKTPTATKHAGFFFSGGIDSLATLRINHLNFHEDHPEFIKDGLLVFGLEVDDYEAFCHVKTALADLANRVGVNLIPIHTNIYLPYRQEDSKNKFRFWINEFMGAGLASVAHAFSNRFSSVSISTTLSIESYPPHGSHPLIDENYSGGSLQIHHTGFELSRLNKTSMLADWEDIINHIRVCNLFDKYNDQKLNCGRCEKCLRTKLALMISGKLNNCTAFADNKVTSDYIRKAVHITPYTENSYIEMLGPLISLGHHDLTKAIKRKIFDFHNPTWKAWKSKVRNTKQNLVKYG